MCNTPAEERPLHACCKCWRLVCFLSEKQICAAVNIRAFKQHLPRCAVNSTVCVGSVRERSSATMRHIRELGAARLVLAKQHLTTNCITHHHELSLFNLACQP